MKWCAFVLVLFFSSCGRQFHFNATGASASDSSYIYRLPYPPGYTHLMIQGYNSRLSHRGRMGLDFKMKMGSAVTAARGGVVVALQESNTKGGARRKYFRQANSVTIRHNDGSFSSYGHLKYNGVVVRIGDTVQQGQLIAYSGSTGYSALPHLHFSVFRNKASGGREMLPTRFYTRKGIQYLRPGRWYRAPQHPAFAKRR
jgi:murein DD-endopeptidase MepM/ murein hydrolase activator NlpD